MPNSTSLLAYPDVKDAFEKALNSVYGVRVSFKSSKEAHRFVGRCNSFRLLDRKENLKIYPEPASTLHGRSVYDVLSLSREDKVVTIVPLKPDDITVEII